ATRRFERRIAALPTQLRTAMLRARTLQESTVDAVLRGEHSAEALLDDLRHVLGPADLTRARTAIEILRDPGLPYALGGGLRGGARPNAAISTMYQALPRTQRSALERAAAADPEFVRAMVHGEHAQGTVRDQPVPWRAEEMDRFLADSGFPAQQRADLENALIRVNRVHRGQRADIEAGAGTGRDARSRAAALDDQAAALGLPERGRIVTALRRSPLLRDLATRNPAQLVDLASDWLVNAARRAEQGRPPEPLDVYVRDRIMTTQIRGMSGELNAVFQLADDLWVLKAPDIRVTDPGTDFIVLHPRTGEIWLSDNKTLSQHGLGEVSSLIQNLGRNLESDVEGLAEAVAGLRDTALPARDLTAVRGALIRLRQARDRVDEVVGRLSREQIDDPRVQARVARILDELRIRRVITNAGGELTHLQARLQQMKVDLADLRAVDFDAGMRPLRKRKRRR
ncbi:MAG TPA: hypothetical protein VFT95_22525, partial [Micromonosporaceae bacterium]|nr:hypothetical protein [Micromonosporaceae bacterium]